MAQQTIWWKDPKVLFSNDNWMYFFPDVDSPLNNAYNAVVRFAIYGGILLWLVTHNTYYLLAIPIVALGTYFVGSVLNKEGFGSLRDHAKHLNCAKPTKDNPFMNTLPHELQTGKAPACDISRPEIQKLADDFLVQDLPMDDPRDIHALRRQFSTVPASTNIADTHSFATFLFGEKPERKLYY